MEQNNLILQIFKNFDYHFNKYKKGKNGLVQLLLANNDIHKPKYFKSGIFHGYGNDDNNLNGFCIVQYFNGKNFIGQFLNNKRNGFGYCTFCDKCYFKGMYQNDQKIEGNVYKLSDDSLVYEGSWENDLYQGQGYLKLLCGQTYQGQFHNGQPHGHGIQTFPEGDIYEGEFQNGKRHGYGLFKSFNGDQYEGEFENNKFNGQGIYIWKNGDKYEGRFTNGNYEQGKMKYDFGVKAQGNFQYNDNIDFQIETPRDQMRVYQSNLVSFNQFFNKIISIQFIFDLVFFTFYNSQK